ncbi:MAG: hypothetical protein FWE91_05800 [Defluviitaleaceae bacterium]|nr:hypothetical protein [Defluviitaleaceae bacterium]MCL2835345.1 hypothetical protein [Defluviitaleaceae bacterium]
MRKFPVVLKLTNKKAELALVVGGCIVAALVVKGLSKNTKESIKNGYSVKIRFGSFEANFNNDANKEAS